MNVLTRSHFGSLFPQLPAGFLSIWDRAPAIGFVSLCLLTLTPSLASSGTHAPLCHSLSLSPLVGSVFRLCRLLPLFALIQICISPIETCLADCLSHLAFLFILSLLVFIHWALLPTMA